MRSSNNTVTVSPTFFPIACRTSALTGSLCLPLPRAINELRNGWPSIFPLTLTRPRVPKNLTESGQTTKVQPPFLELFCSLAVNVFFTIFGFPILSIKTRLTTTDEADSTPRPLQPAQRLFCCRSSRRCRRRFGEFRRADWGVRLHVAQFRGRLPIHPRYRPVKGHLDSGDRAIIRVFNVQRSQPDRSVGKARLPHEQA